MTLGSPQKGPNYGSKSQTTSSYLPSYLIGSTTTTPTTARSLQSAVSPKNVSFRTNENQMAKPRFPVEKNDGKANGPPVSALNSLFSPQSTPNRTFAGSATILHNESAHEIDSADMLQSPSQLDPFFQEGGEVSMDPTWVTVFGFPNAAESFILRQFRQYGVILQFVSQHSQANWIHIQYKTKIQARKALSKNGKIIEGQIMIGVVPCVREPVKMATSPDRSHVLESITNIKSPSQTRKDSILGQTLEVGGNTPNRSFNGMRRMTSTNNCTISNNSQVQNTNTPQKNGYIGKTMSYIFGEW